jgi:hypothetical protein
MVLADEADRKAVWLGPLTALNFSFVVKISFLSVTAKVKSAICL